MGEYDLLSKWLSTQRTQRVSLRFCEIKSIISDDFPKSHRRYRPWWGNEIKGRHRQCRSWMDAGWQVEVNGVDLGTETVTFSRQGIFPGK